MADTYSWEEVSGAAPSYSWDEVRRPARKNPDLEGEPTALDRLLAKLPDWMAGPSGGIRGSAVGGMMQGAAEPGVAIAQGVANLAGLIPGARGIADTVNQRVRDQEEQYQAARADAGRGGGVDWSRMAGNVAMTAPLGFVGGPATGVLSAAGKGALQGAAAGALQPVSEGDNYWTGKAKDIGIGAAGGAALSPLATMLSRVVSPRASTNPELALLMDEGVRPSVGQALGGTANQIEQKLMSVPIVGDAAAAMRRKAMEDFNAAAINRATRPIGADTEKAGADVIAQAGDLISAKYDEALAGIKGVFFDTPRFNQKLSQLSQMTDGLVAGQKEKFDKVLNSVVLGRMSPIGAMQAETFKKVDSDVGRLARAYSKSPSAAEQELGDAFQQLQAIMRDEVAASNPGKYGQMLDAANRAWANLVRVEKAGVQAMNSGGGVFTPAQLNSAVRQSDSTVRHRGMLNSSALMSDLSSAGQNVLGNRVPDSGTATRLLWGAGGLATGFANPAIPAALIGGAAAYSRPVQNALVRLITQRPDMAPEIANYLRLLSGPMGVAGGIGANDLVESYR